MLPPACFRNLPLRPPSSSDTSPRPDRRSGARPPGARRRPAARHLWRFCANFRNSVIHPRLQGFTGFLGRIMWCVGARSAARLAAGKFLVRDGGLHGVGRVVGGSSVRLMRGVWTYPVTGVAVAAAGIGSWQAAADTLEWALVQAYQNNPSLNAQRAALRATDENVPQALSGYRPKLSVTASGGAEYQKSASQIPVGTGVVNSTAAQTFYPRVVFRYPKKSSENNNMLFHSIWLVIRTVMRSNDPSPLANILSLQSQHLSRSRLPDCVPRQAVALMCQPPEFCGSTAMQGSA
jgi:hypothetical protein